MQSLRKYGDGFAIIMSSFVFALMHGNMIQIPFAFIAGIGIGYAVIKTGTMWTGIIIHFINNAIAVISMTVSQNCSDEITNMFSMILYTVVFAVGIICFALYANDRKQRLSAELFQKTLFQEAARLLLQAEKKQSALSLVHRW